MKVKGAGSGFDCWPPKLVFSIAVSISRDTFQIGLFAEDKIEVFTTIATSYASTARPGKTWKKIPTNSLFLEITSQCICFILVKI